MEAPADELTEIASAREWKIAETGGVVLLLFLTSVRTAWLPEITKGLSDCAGRSETGRVPVLSVFRLDKRYPLDIGFDGNLSELGEAHRTLHRLLSANAVVIEFEGLLASTLRAALKGLEAVSRSSFPRSFHSTVVSGASWIAPHVPESQRRDVRHYIDAMKRMKMDLGCPPEPTSGVSFRAQKPR